MPDHKKPDPATIAIHADGPLNETASLAPPIYQTSTFVAEDGAAFTEMATTPRHDHFYARYGNPNHSQAGEVLAQLEGGDYALLTGSGMGAVSTVLMGLLASGAHVVAQQVHYGGTLGLLSTMLPRFGVQTTFVEQADVNAFREAIRPETRLIMLETPTNPLMTLTDLAGVVGLAKEHGIPTVADNTFATPINQRPLDFGVDIVLHSATKYLGGHHDLIAGALICGEDYIDQLWKASIGLGVSLNGFDSWLLLRGLRTLKLRVQQHNANALAIARALHDHPRVATVYYPGLDSHPQHALAQKQMSGYTGMLSFELAGDFALADKFIDKLTLIDRAASLGGVHTLIVHPAAMMAAVMSEEEFEARGVRPSLVRLSVGLEDVEDLLADIQQALAAL